MQAAQLGGPRRHEQHVAGAEQSLRADRIENRARIHPRGHLQRDPRRQIRLDKSGQHVNRRPLRGQNQMDTGGARLLRETGYIALDGLALAQ